MWHYIILAYGPIARPQKFANTKNKKIISQPALKDNVKQMPHNHSINPKPSARDRKKIVKGMELIRVFPALSSWPVWENVPWRPFKVALNGKP